MPTKKKNTKFWLFNFLLLFVLFLVQYNGAFSIKIRTANPMLPLCCVLAVAMFTSELQSVIFALFAGIITDCAAAVPLCFNTMVMMLLALAVSLAVKYLLNNNLRSAALIGICGGGIYYFLRWIFSVFSSNLESELDYLLNYALPSVIYTAVILLPLYFFEKFLIEKFYVR